MKLYLASSAPGNETEEKFFLPRHRMLSYHNIVTGGFAERPIFQGMIKLLTKQGAKNASQKSRITKSV